MPGPTFHFVSRTRARRPQRAAKDPLYQQHAEIFFSLYFIMTGMHATHMIIGIGILAVLVVLLLAGASSTPSTTTRWR